ncbi:MAG: Na-translocating system protein MpsC family protein [Solirubrobacteraceae bacterium]
MTASTEPDQHSNGNSLSAAISHTIVGVMREYTGRGPTKARTTIRDNVVVVILEQSLSKGEQSLAVKGRGEKVLEIRHEFQEAMREESSAKIAELTGRHVVAMLSANHLDPDLAAEIYVLDQPPDQRARTWETVAEVADTNRHPSS